MAAFDGVPRVAVVGLHRGVDVEPLAEATQSRIETTKVDAATPDATVVTGSFRFTWTAQQKNAENILILRNDPMIAARYALNRERHLLDTSPFAVLP